MRGVFNFFVALFIVFSFASCQSYRTIGIEMFQPASITFPPDIRTVMIIDNAVQQPDDFGHQLLYFQNQDSTLSIPADSMAYYFCLSLGKAIAGSPLFDDVRLCEDTLRYDTDFYLSQPFTSRKVQSLCDAYQVDALISLDKLIFKTVLLFKNTYTYSDWNILSVEVAGELKAVWPEINKAFTIPFVDSLIWSLDYYTTEPFSVQDIQYCMRYLSEYVAQNMHVHFVPHWVSDERWFYTSIYADWKRATAYAAAEKWELAANSWLPLFEKTNKKSQKARLASNLALVHEMNGDFMKALAYAEIAYSIVKEITAEDDKYRNMQRKYLELLTKRLEDDQKLSEQLGER